MARRIKSFAHGAGDANPFEPYHTKVSPFHREHRSKKGRTKPIPHYGGVVIYKQKLKKLKEKELEDEEREILGG